MLLQHLIDETRPYLNYFCTSLQVRAALGHDSSGTVPAHMAHVDLLFWPSQIEGILHFPQSRTSYLHIMKGAAALSTLLALALLVAGAFPLPSSRIGNVTVTRSLNELDAPHGGCLPPQLSAISATRVSS